MLILAIVFFSISCSEKPKVVENTTVKVTLSQAEKDLIEVEEIYGFDTLLIKEYTSDDGNRIELRGVVA